MLLNATPLNRLVLNGTGGYYDGLAASISVSATVASAPLSKRSNAAVNATASLSVAPQLKVTKPISGAASAAVTTTSPLGVVKRVSSSALVSASASASAQKRSNAAASVTMAGLTVASASIGKVIAASATGRMTISASAKVNKVAAAAASAAMSISVSALLGKRLQGSLSAAATTNAQLGILVNAAASLSVTASASGSMLKASNQIGDLLARIDGRPMVYVERTIRSPLNRVTAKATGLLCFTHLVAAEVGGNSTFEQELVEIFAEAELIDTWKNYIQVELSSTVFPITAEAEVILPEWQEAA